MLRLISAILLFALLGCNSPFSKKEGKPYKVLLLVPNDQGGYSFETKTIETMDDPTTVEGANLKVRINSKFYPDRIEDQIPHASYRVNEDGVLLPADTNSMLYYGLYYNMEQLLKFDQQIGLVGALPYPRIASIQTDVIKSFSGPVRVWKNNLAYLPGYDRIIVYKFDESVLPAPLNLGLVAHEHFHAIFEKIVEPTQMVQFEIQREEIEQMQKTREKKIQQLGLTKDQISKLSPQQLFDQLQPSDDEVKEMQAELKTIHSGSKGYNYLMLNALTEGFADFWAWLITGKELPAEDTFTSSDLKKFNIENRKVNNSVVPVYAEYNMKLDFNYNAFTTQEQGMAKKSDDGFSVRDYFYIYGSKYSVLLRSLSETIAARAATPSEAKVQIGRWMIQGLSRIRGRLGQFNQTKDADEMLTQDLILEGFVPDNLEEAQLTEVCTKIKTFLLFQEETYSKLKKCESVK